jgi:hypothetical protein
LDDLIDGHLDGSTMMGLLLDLIEPRLRDSGGGTIGDLEFAPEGVAIAKTRKVRMKVGMFLGFTRKSGCRSGKEFLRVFDSLGAADTAILITSPTGVCNGPASNKPRRGST